MPVALYNVLYMSAAKCPLSPCILKVNTHAPVLSIDFVNTHFVIVLIGGFPESWKRALRAEYNTRSVIVLVFPTATSKPGASYL